MQKVLYRDLGRMEYRQAWDYQEELLRENVRIKSEMRQRAEIADAERFAGSEDQPAEPDTLHYLLFVEHPPVYTLGKSGHMANMLIGEEQVKAKGLQFFHTNRGGDITFHGPGQVVGY